MTLLKVPTTVGTTLQMSYLMSVGRNRHRFSRRIMNDDFGKFFAADEIDNLADFFEEQTDIMTETDMDDWSGVDAMIDYSEFTQ